MKSRKPMMLTQLGIFAIVFAVLSGIAYSWCQSNIEMRYECHLQPAQSSAADSNNRADGPYTLPPEIIPEDMRHSRAIRRGCRFGPTQLSKADSNNRAPGP